MQRSIQNQHDKHIFDLDRNIPNLNEVLLQLIKSLDKNSVQSPVLIGGQALSFWANHYQLPLSNEPSYQLATQDIDFLGNRSNVEQAAKILDSRLKLPLLDDNTISSGCILVDDIDNIALGRVNNMLSLQY